MITLLTISAFLNIGLLLFAIVVVKQCKDLENEIIKIYNTINNDN